MIPIYSMVLSVIEKALQELMEKYWDIRRSFWNLVEGQEKNMVQLAKIRAAVK